MKRTTLAILSLSIILVVVVSGFMLLKVEPTASQMPYPSSTETTSKNIDTKKAPDFTFKATDGKSYKLSDFKGKGVILNFWATWCPPCREEIPDMVILQSAYEKQGFTFIGIALEADEDKVKAFALDKKINYPVGLGSNEIAANYGKLTQEGAIRGIPTSFVINGQGDVVDYFVGGRDQAAFTEAIKKSIAK